MISLQSLRRGSLCGLSLGFLLLAVAPAPASASVYDVLMPEYAPNPNTCKGPCRNWNAISDDPKVQGKFDAMWLNGKPPSDAQNSCAMPATTAGEFECDGCTVDVVTNSFAGPWCYCDQPIDGQNHTQYCVPSATHPEQINLQVASEDIVVVSFVTHDVEPSSQSPVAMFGPSESEATEVTGVSHLYKKLSQAENMTYILHFVKLAGLTPSIDYVYKVRSGSPNAPWSNWFKFRSLSTAENGAPTRLGIYGDMGHSRYNAMGNLLEDCLAGRIEAIVHMGDHAYDLGNAGDKRGDAYMNSFQPALSTCPWIPIIGNHEHNDGDSYQRYLNMTWGETLGEDEVHSTATSALGDLLTKATLFGPGFHSKVPSNTSRYFSLEFGLVHIAGLDLNDLDDGQLAWLDADLSSVNRTRTPWVIVSSHFPLHHEQTANHPDASLAYFIGEEAEKYATSGHEFIPARCGKEFARPGGSMCEETVGEMFAKVGQGLEPLLKKHGVDIYDAGHNHDYNPNWPICYDENTGAHLCKKTDGSEQKDFNRPLGTVHICEGNGGVPGVVGKSTLTMDCGSTKAPWCRAYGTGGAYGRITAFNTTHLLYEHVQNNGGIVTDSFVIFQDNHGPFSSKK